MTDLMEMVRQSVEAGRSRRTPGTAHEASWLTTADQEPSKATDRSKVRSRTAKAGSSSIFVVGGTGGSDGDRTRSSPVAER